MTWEPDYITSAELKAELRITDTDDDTQVARWVTAASRAVDTWAHRQFGKVATTEVRTYRTGAWDRHIQAYVVELDDLYTTTGFAIADADGTAITDYELLPDNAIQKGKPYERAYVQVCGTLTVTGSWGWSAVPTNIKVATLIQAARFAARRDSPFGIAGSPTAGSELRLLARVDPDVEVAIGKKFRREWWAA